MLQLGEHSGILLDQDPDRPPKFSRLFLTPKAKKITKNYASTTFELSCSQTDSDRMGKTTESKWPT